MIPAWRSNLTNHESGFHILYIIGRDIHYFEQLFQKNCSGASCVPKKPSRRMGRCWRLDGFLRSDGGLTPLGILFKEARAQRNCSKIKEVEPRVLSWWIPSHRARRLALLVGVCASYVQCRSSVLWQDRFTHGSADFKGVRTETRLKRGL